MEKNSLKKMGVVFMVMTAIMFGAIVGLTRTSSLLVTVTTLVVMVACIFIGHFLVTTKLNQGKRAPIEVLIIFFADFAFGVFAGVTLESINPAYLLIAAALVAICGFLGFFIIFLKSPVPDATNPT